MPRCCAGDRCEFPTLGLHGGPGGIKNCPDCGEKIHDVCAFEDDAAGLSEMNVCPDCWDARKPPWSELAFEEGISAICEGCSWKVGSGLSLSL
jgi:hypothetical protein